MTLAYILGASFLVSVGGTGAAAAILLFPDEARCRLTRVLLAFAVGVLLSAALLGLIPHAVEQGGELEPLMVAMLVTFVVLIGIEKVILWGHSHPEEEGHRQHHHEHTMGPMVLIADALHNLVDGVVIAAAFSASTSLGLATTLAVAAHEIPHEVSDFAVLIQAGYSRGKALLANMLAAGTTFIGALLAYFVLAGVQAVLPYALAVSAASFLYIAIAALVPVLHSRTDLKSTLIQLASIGAGIGLSVMLHEWL
ncbi:MAG: ZIP family metal transporter [Deltaproteobacteria bacterium]|nr:ZIP family metal transporter [Deltaproteobacteria bacterium]